MTQSKWMCGASWPKKSQELREYILRKTIRDQRLLPAQNNRDDCEITNDGQTDLRAEETSCKNMKSIQENLTLAKEDSQPKCRSIPNWCGADTAYLASLCLYASLCTTHPQWKGQDTVNVCQSFRFIVHSIYLEIIECCIHINIPLACFCFYNFRY